MKKPVASSLKLVARKVPSFLFQVPSSKLQAQQGFTTVERIVAVALFAIAMAVAVAALLSLTAANRKAQAIQSVMNNLNIAVDGMVRNMRMGTNYIGATAGEGCESNTGGGTNDCTGGGPQFEFDCNPLTASCKLSTDQSWTYRYDPNGTVCDQEKSICRTMPDGTFSPITSPDVDIDELIFYVVGTTEGDTTQPKVVIVIKGTAGTQNQRTKSEFHIQATAVQRELDL